MPLSYLWTHLPEVDGFLLLRAGLIDISGPGARRFTFPQNVLPSLQGLFSAVLSFFCQVEVAVNRDSQ